MGKELKRYNLALPEELYTAIHRIAIEKQTTVVEVLRKFIKLGLLVTTIENDPDAELIIREGDKEKQVLLL